VLHGDVRMHLHDGWYELDHFYALLTLGHLFNLLSFLRPPLIIRVVEVDDLLFFSWSFSNPTFWRDYLERAYDL
jgi:hypothetical protein